MPAKLKRSAKTSGGVLCSKEAMNGLISKRAVGLLGSHLSSVGNPAPPPRPDDVDDSFLDDDLDFVGSTIKRHKTSDVLKKMMKLKANQTEQAQQAREAFEKAQSELGDVDDEEGLETWSQEDVLVKVNQMKEDNKRRLSNTFKERSMPIWQEPVLNKVQVKGLDIHFDNELQDGAASACSDAESDMETSNISKEMLTGGWLLQHHMRLRKFPEQVCRMLFRAIYLHQDDAVCQAAFKALAAMANGGWSDAPQLWGSTSATPMWSSSLHPYCQDGGIHMGWLPSIEDYRNAFVSVGLPVSKNGNHQSTVPAEGSAATGNVERVPDAASLHRLVLLLRMLTVCCRSCTDRSVSKKASADLLLSLLKLHCDPAAPSFHCELKAAVKTLILWVPHDDWDAIQDFVGRKIHESVPSHAATVFILQQLPLDTARGWELQSHAALLALAPTLQKRPPKSNCKSKLQTVLATLGDAGELARSSRQPGKADFWALSSALRLADMIFWKDANQNGEISTSQQDENDVEVADMLKKWGEFLQKLARHVRATSQDESENQARLLLAELSSYYDFIKRQHLI